MHRPIAQVGILVVIAIWLAAGCSDSGSSSAGTDGDQLPADGDSGFDCPAGYICDPCTTNIDCPAGMVCDATAGFCVPSGMVDGDGIDGDADKVETDGDDTVVDTDGRRIEIVPLNVDFGAVQWGHRVTEEVTVRNASAATVDLEVQSIQFLTEGEIDYSFELWDPVAGLAVTLPHTLRPAQSFIVKITYAPSDERDDGDEQLLISSNDADAAIIRANMDPQYKGEANVSIEPSPIIFENTPVFASGLQTIRISNAPEDEDSNRVLKVTSITLQNGQLVDDGYKLSLPRLISESDPVFLVPGDAIEATLEFAPKDMIDYPNALFVVCNDPDDGPNVEVAITARGIQADLVVSPMPVDFGARAIGETHLLAVEVLNVGNDEFPVLDIQLLDGNSRFTLVSVAPELPWTLLSGQSGSLQISFTPERIDAEVDRLFIDGGANDEGELKPDYFVDVRGEGRQALIRLEPDQLDFGDVQHGQEAIEAVRVYNDGSEDLKITSLEMNPIGSPDFGWIDVAEIYDPIPPGQSRAIEFTYRQNVGGDRSACAIYSNAGNADADGAFTLQMQAASTDPIFFASPEVVDFPETEIRDTEQITVKNLGDGTLTIFNVAVDVGSSPDFGVENFKKGGAAATLPLALGQSETLTFDAVYAPTLPGQATGALAIVHDDYDEFQPGDLDRTEFHLLLNAAGPLNHPPVAGIRANGGDTDLALPLGTMILLDDDGVYDDGAGSYDVDAGDTIVDWEFAIESAPDGHGDLAGTDNVRSVSANVPGEWIFSLRVKDQRDAWSQKDSILVKVTTGPVAVLRVNGYTDAPPPVRAGVEIVLDGIPSHDPDGGNIAEWEFRVESAPPGADITLTGSGSSRTIVPRRLGTFSFGLRVKDDEGTWSGWDSLSVESIAPETINIVMGDINWCIAELGFDLLFYNLSGEVCGPPPGYTCLWGPRHSGDCSGILHNDGASEIVWDYSEFHGDYQDVDGEYRITVKSRSWLNMETVTIKLYKDGASDHFWEGSHKFGILETTWNIYLRRTDGVWQDPHLCSPGGCGTP
ncbi:MAG: choice-of-anchor D domain-containing protein [Myxococcales bacterium]|nr:MAG: choice-of-anchor D domain-containing protein [Myxococcales bacterium]